MDFGTELKQKRKLKGLTQDELAGKLNVTRLTVIQWEKSLYTPEEDQVKQLSKLLNMDEKMFHVKHTKENILFWEGLKASDPVEVNPLAWFSSAKGAIRVSDSSMASKFPVGCIVMFKETDRETIVIDEVYLIDLHDRKLLRTIERVTAAGIKIKAESNNTMEIAWGKVRAIYLVIAKIEFDL